MGINSESRLNTLQTVKVFYGNHRLNPAPLLDLTTEIQRQDDGTRAAEINRFTLNGVYFLPSGSFEQMWKGGKQELERIFRNDYEEFRIVAGPGNVTLAENAVITGQIYPRVLSVNVEPDILVQRLNYTVELEASSGIASSPVESYSDSWQFQEEDTSRTIRVTHNVSARGINTAISGTNAYIHALNFVKARLGYDKIPAFVPQFTEPNASGGATITTRPISTQRTESLDEGGGSYQANEIFIIASGTVTYFDERAATFDEDDAGIATVRINGTVQGLERTNFNTDGGQGFTNAINAFRNTVRPGLALYASGVYLNYKDDSTGSGLKVNSPIALSVTENRFLGNVQYSISYTDDPAQNLPSGIAERTSSFNKVFAQRTYASHPIAFRSDGNFVQDTESTTEGQITISCSVTAENSGDATVDTNLAIKTVEDELNRLRPNRADYITLRQNNKQQTHNDRELTAQASVSYIFTVNRAATPVANDEITLDYIT